MSDHISTQALGVIENGLLKSLPITEIDRKIIAHLQQDGRRRFVAIGTAIGVTEKTVRAHVKTLFDQQIIQIVALTSPAALGYSVSALAAISIDSPASGSRIADALAHIDRIDYVALTYSRFAIFAEIIAQDMQELQETIDTRIGTIEGVTGIELFPYFSVHYQQAQIMRVNVLDEDGVIDAELADTDKAIVAELALDGRAPFGQVANRLSLSESHVRARVQHMVSSRQLKIMAIVNPLKLFDYTMAWVAIRVATNTKISDVANALSKLPGISYVVICAGQFDIFSEIICTSQAELLRALETQIRPLEGVAHAEAFIYTNLHYKRLLPVHVKGRTAADAATVHSLHEFQP